VIYVLGFLLAMAIGLLFNYGAHRRPTPKPGDQ
jgi:hypothetical protein